MSKPDPQNIEVAEQIVLQFGKYRGKTLDEVPEGYLYWLAENHESEFLCTAADTVYREKYK